MSHCWLFTVYVFLLLSTHYLFLEKKTKYAVSTGMLVGLAALIRPTDIIAGLIPLFWGLNSLSKAAVTAHFKFLFGHTRLFICVPIAAFSVYCIQLVYWKYATGHWLYYSYGDQSFSFLHPHPFLYTFSYRTGWLRYTPVFFLSFAGIMPFFRQARNTISILSFFFINYYIVCAWDIWWYGGRAMVQSYPVLLFPMASYIEMVYNHRIWKWIFYFFAAIFIYANLWIMRMYHGGNLYDPDGMNKNYYWHVIGRWSVPDSVKTLKGKCDLFEGKVHNLQLVFDRHFTTDSGDYFVSDPASGHSYLRLDKNHQINPDIVFPLDEGKGNWLRMQARIRSKEGQLPVTQFIIRLMDSKAPKDHQLQKEGVIDVSTLMEPGADKNVAYDLNVSGLHYDKAVVLFWNADSDKEVWIDSIRVWSFKD
jgi:hypothetical protein